MQEAWYCDVQDKEKPGDKPMVDQIAQISPDGEDEEKDALFKTMISEGLIEGGPGTDYLLAAYPLSLFDLEFGDEVRFSAAYEVGSNKYHHEAIDVIANEPGAKNGNIIKYMLGANTYEEIINNEDEKN